MKTLFDEEVLSNKHCSAKGRLIYTATCWVSSQSWNSVKIYWKSSYEIVDDI